jgi:hypothetical protein
MTEGLGFYADRLARVAKEPSDTRCQRWELRVATLWTGLVDGLEAPS